MTSQRGEHPGVSAASLDRERVIIAIAVTVIWAFTVHGRDAA